MATTGLSPNAGLPMRPYGSFAGKEAAVVPAAVITQLAAHAGLPMRRYGSFAGKEASAAVAAVAGFEGLRRNTGRLMR